MKRTSELRTTVHRLSTTLTTWPPASYRDASFRYHHSSYFVDDLATRARILGLERG